MQAWACPDKPGRATKAVAYKVTGGVCRRAGLPALWLSSG